MLQATFMHSHTDVLAVTQGASTTIMSNLGFSILAKDTLTCGLENKTTSLQISGQPALHVPPESQLTNIFSINTPNID